MISFQSSCSWFTDESLIFYRNLLGKIEIEAEGFFAQGNGYCHPKSGD
jgi:hypothetical protein